MQKYNIVIDTNVIVSALLSKRGASYKLLELIGKSNKFEINISVNLFFEYEAVSNRQKNISLIELDELMLYLFKNANKHNIFISIRPFLLDSKDDFIVELAVQSKSDFIITYNKKHFTNIEKFGIKALTSKEFLEFIGEL